VQPCPGKVAQNLLASGWTISSCVQWSLFLGWTILHPVSNDHYFSYAFSLHSRKALANKSVGSESFVVSLQARNKFSKPSRERSATCEQDRPASKIDVCMWFCISRHEDMATLQPCSDVSMMTVIWVCVILHIASWRYGRIVTLFWCINDDCNVCVCDFASQETCLCD
jgi:hypothetical protein